MEDREHPLIEAALAGLQAGILAGSAMILWIMLGCWVQGLSVWTIPNLLAATFHGGRMYRPDFLWRTFSGLGLHFVFAGVTGVLFALFCPRTWRPFSSALLGLVYSLVLYSWAGTWFWQKFNSPLGAYSRQGFVFAGYLLFGVLLGFTPSFLGSSREAGSALPTPLGNPSAPES